MWLWLEFSNYKRISISRKIFDKFTKTLEMLNKYYDELENPIKINEFLVYLTMKK